MKETQVFLHRGLKISEVDFRLLTASLEVPLGHPSGENRTSYRHHVGCVFGLFQTLDVNRKLCRDCWRWQFSFSVFDGKHFVLMLCGLKDSSVPQSPPLSLLAQSCFLGFLFSFPFPVLPIVPYESSDCFTWSDLTPGSCTKVTEWNGCWE